MLFLLFGSSGSGKTTALLGLRGRLDGVALHDFDEIGVPRGADTAWRHRADERWVRRALAYQDAGIDMLLAGQTPPGELLATASAPLLDGVAACLLDCDDETRLARLRAREPAPPAELGDYIAWAAWLRGHARSPRWQPHVMHAAETASEMDWARPEGDWRVRVVDTSKADVAETASELAAWVEEERALRAS